eukprot:COSAG05_NODE_176_length_14928_cov_75.109717_13_plen_60_part_00
MSTAGVWLTGGGGAAAAASASGLIDFLRYLLLENATRAGEALDALLCQPSKLPLGPPTP